MLPCILVLSVLFSALASAEDVDCPPGWRDGASVGLGCLLFSAETGMNWNDASDFCKTGTGQVRAHLIEIFTSEQMDFMMAELGLFEAEVERQNYLHQ